MQVEVSRAEKELSFGRIFFFSFFGTIQFNYEPKRFEQKAASDNGGVILPGLPNRMLEFD